MFFVIYALVGESGEPFYVGSTNNPHRRMKEHRRKLRYKPSYIVLEEGYIGRYEAEEKWINHYRSILGDQLTNKAEFFGGRQQLPESSRKLISLANKGRIVPADLRQRLSEASRGKPRGWTKNGEKRVQKTQFKKGHRPKSASEEKRRNSIREHWQSLSAEKKSKILDEANLKAWAARCPDERKRIGRKIAEARAKNNCPEKISQDTKHAANMLWSKMTPEYRADFIRRRAETLKATLARKRQAQ